MSGGAVSVAANCTHLYTPPIEFKHWHKHEYYSRILSSASNEVHYDKIGDHRPGYDRRHDYLCTNTVDWNCSGSRLLVACKEFLQVFDSSTKTEEKKIASPVKWHGASFIPNEDSVLVGLTKGGLLQAFDLRQGSLPSERMKTVMEIDLKLPEIGHWAWHPSGKYLTINDKSAQPVLKVVELNSKPRILVETKMTGTMSGERNQMVYSPDGDKLFVAGGVAGDGVIDVFSGPSALNLDSRSHILHGHHHHIIALAADRGNGSCLAAGGADCLITLWDTNSLVCLKSMVFPTQPVQTLDLSHDGFLLAWASQGEKCFCVAGAQSGVSYRAEESEDILCGADVLSLKWHPHQATLAFALDDHCLDSTSSSRARGWDRLVQIFTIGNNAASNC
eukprot:GHVL01025088.1.p1 GENE.GHVL01025088.1~~GHVL01025088.1.p1  ORF type:complete len:390 (+),score=47.66 GHVL01025088.1:90-1259(+)